MDGWMNRSLYIFYIYVAKKANIYFETNIAIR